MANAQVLQSLAGTPYYTLDDSGNLTITGNLAVTGTATAAGGVTGVALAADESVVATCALADATGGGTTAALSVTLKQRDNSTAISSARQVLLVLSTTQYVDSAGPTNASLSLGTVTSGSIVATIVAGSIYLIETTAAGLFACTATNTDDETVYVSAKSAAGGVSAIGKRCVVVGSNSDSGTWSA